MTLSRRDSVKLLGTGAVAPILDSATPLGFRRPNYAEEKPPASPAITTQPAARSSTVSAPLGDLPPSILYFQVDNLGMGELGCYGGGILRGASTRRIDRFAAQGTQPLNFGPEAQCTPSRAALMTGRYSIR